MRARRMTALAVAMVAVLGTGGLAACSDDDGDDDIALEDIGDDDTTTTEAPSDDDEDDTDSTDTTLAGGDFAEGCVGFTEAFTGLAESLGGGGDIDDEALDEFDAAIAEAPEDVRDDLQVYADTFRQYARAIEETGFDPSNPEDVDPGDAQALAELAQLFASEEFLEASTAINDFVSSNCAAG